MSKPMEKLDGIFQAKIHTFDRCGRSLAGRILREDMPEETFLVGYADDIAAVITARNTEEAQ